MMFCQSCGETLVEGSRFCHQCGQKAPVTERFSEPPPPEGLSAKPRLDWFLLTLLGSLGLTLILTLVFHLPIFILGAFLPFFWQVRGKHPPDQPR
jgi:hypothetical protein